MQPLTSVPTGVSIHPDTTLGLVAIAVADLARSRAFYQDVLGFTVLRDEPGRALLGVADQPLLILQEQPGARPAPPRATGLDHFAILVPTRADLARSLLHLVESGYPLGGAADHLVSEALYLSDPDGNGIEIYRDRPRAEWLFRQGRLQMTTDPLDLRALLREAQAENQPWTGLAPGTRLGHMHLQVADLPAARAFYHDLLGFDVMVDMEPMGALFLSAGGYHHHLGLNTWQSRGGRPAPDGHAVPRYFTVHLPDAAALNAVLARLDAAGIAYQSEPGGAVVADPWGNLVALRLGPTLTETGPTA
jgi:catechol 2,3-dioxygenase